MPELLAWLESTWIAAIARESLYGFQILVGIHILGLIFSVGTLLWVDLRMLGLALGDRRLSAVYAALSRWFLPGFAVMVVSGTMLFAGFATAAYGNAYFRVKILAMLAAGANAIAFHVLLRRTAARADAGAPTRIVRVSGMLSIALWAGVILCGRMMSYTLF